eukprot:740540-Pleurochrysis_carterae.AAC.1
MAYSTETVNYSILLFGCPPWIRLGVASTVVDSDMRSIEEKTYDYSFSQRSSHDHNLSAQLDSDVTFPEITSFSWYSFQGQHQLAIFKQSDRVKSTAGLCTSITRTLHKHHETTDSNMLIQESLQAL